MDIIFKTRQLYPREIRLLQTLKNRKEKESTSKIKSYHFLVVAAVAVGFTYLASLSQNSFWVLAFGTIAVLAYGFIVFVPFELYKLTKRHKDCLQQLGTIINTGTVDTLLVNAKKIAIAEEYEDEGDLFIIEYDTDKILYLWDCECNLRKTLPCLSFEIYEDSFLKLTGRQFYALSGRTDAYIIDKKAKRSYLDKIGFPAHLQTENINFAKLIHQFNDCA